jgi:hypothetical protein
VVHGAWADGSSWSKVIAISLKKSFGLEIHHATSCSDGVREGFAPVTLCDVSRISMILGPDGELDRTVAPCLDCRQIVLARAVSNPREL